MRNRIDRVLARDDAGNPIWLMANVDDNYPWGLSMDDSVLLTPRFARRLARAMTKWADKQEKRKTSE